MGLLGTLWAGAKAIGKSVLKSFNPFNDESYRKASREEQDTFKSKVEVIANDPNLDHEYRMEAQKVLAQIESYRHAEELARIEGTTQITIAQILATKEVIVARVDVLKESVAGARRKEVALINAMGNSPEMAAKFLERLDKSEEEIEKLSIKLDAYTGEIFNLTHQKPVSLEVTNLLSNVERHDVVNSEVTAPEQQDLVSLEATNPLIANEKQNFNEWSEILFEWADDNDIPVRLFPRTAEGLTSLSKLGLAGYSLNFLPKEVGNLTNLTDIDLRECGLTSLPKEIGNLTNLTYVNVAENKLTTLPQEIGNLSSLVKLTLCFNNIATLPKEIGNLANLKEMFVRDNKFTTLPKEMGHLVNLEVLDLSWTPVEIIPQMVSGLPKLEKLYT